MNKQEREQIENIVNNFLDAKGYFPFLVDLETHPMFGPIFKTLKTDEKKKIEKIIDEMIVEKIKSYKTKGGELFRRYFEVNEDDFWKFRDMNCNDNFAQTKKFQELGNKVESEIFKYEGILTDKMLDQEKGLDKVVGAFYNIVYSYFPKLNLVDDE